MAQISLTFSVRYRHRWLGAAFIRLTAVPVYLGWDPSERAMQRIANAAYWLMGPKYVIG